MPKTSSTMKYGRGTAEYLGGTRIRFTWPCGHKRTQDYSKGRVSRRMGESGCRWMASWWSAEKGGVILGPCPRGCSRPTGPSRGPGAGAANSGARMP